MYLRVRDDYDSVSFSKVTSVSLSMQQIRALSLYECKNLECAKLSNFPELRSLAIYYCKNLKSVIGWEVVKELGWLEIRYCDSYEDFPCVQCLPSSRELRLSSALQMIPVPDLSQCVRLRRLEFCGTDSSARNGMDLSTLRFLEVLNFYGCSTLTTIQGLSGLHSLTELELGGCRALRRVPELGCSKALTHLDLSGSGVEEIPGVQELHLLTLLVLSSCSSMKTLPWLGHLKALAYLNMGGMKTLPWLGHLKALAYPNMGGSGVEEIPGVEDLVRLDTLLCTRSRLKGLPDLHHLPRLSTTDPSVLYYGKQYLEYTSNGNAERVGFVDESVILVIEYSHSDDDSC